MHRGKVYIRGMALIVRHNAGYMRDVSVSIVLQQLFVLGPYALHVSYSQIALCTFDCKHWRRWESSCIHCLHYLRNQL